MQQVDTRLLGFSPQDAVKASYIASMGVYVFKTDILLKLLRWRYPTANDFGSEIIPRAVKEHNVQVRELLNLVKKISSKFKKCSVIAEGCFFPSNARLWLISLFWQAFIFRDYWEDIGTIKSFFDANLALTEEVDLIFLRLTSLNLIIPDLHWIHVRFC